MAVLAGVCCLLNKQAVGQCYGQVADFPDSVCSNGGFAPYSLDSGFQSYEWLVGLPEISFATSPANLGNVGSSIQIPSYGLSLIKEGVQWYGFSKKVNARAVYRYEFGASLTNTPTAHALVVDSFVGATQQSTDDINFVNVDGVWYGFTPLPGVQSILRYVFGESLDSDTVSPTSLGNLGGLLHSPSCVDVDVFNDSIIFTVGNVNQNSFAILNMGTNPMNTTPVWTKLISTNVSPVVSFISTIALEYTCGRWVCFVCGRGNDNLVRYSFGNSLHNMPVAEQIGAVGDFLEPYSMQVEHGLGYPQLFVKSQTTTQNILRVHFRDSLTQSVATVGYQNFTAQASVMRGYAFDMGFDQNGLHLFVLNSNNDMRRATMLFENGVYPHMLQGEEWDSVAFTSTKPYTISLLATDGAGNKAYALDTVYVALSPEAHLSLSNTCFGDTTALHGQNTNTNVTATSVFWDLGNGLVSAPYDTLFAFPDTGLFSVSFALGANGCVDVTDTTIFIMPLPVAEFPADTFCQGQEVELWHNSTVYATDSIAQVRWVVGEADTSFVNPLTMSFATAGSFVIALDVETTHGCRDAFLDSVFVLEAPVADFLVDSTCFGDTTTFENLASYSGSFTSTWKFGDGVQAFTQHAKHVYGDTGYLTASLKTEAENGCVDSSAQLVRISPMPSLDFSLGAVRCQHQPIVFSEALGSQDAVVHRQFVFGADTCTPSGNTFMFDLFGPGSLTYIVTVGSQCHAVAQLPILINAHPNTVLSVSDSCSNAPIALVHTTTYADGQHTATTWWEVNGQSSPTSSFTYEPSLADTLHLRLEVTSDSGCVTVRDSVFALWKAADVHFVTGAPRCSNLPLTVSVETIPSAGNPVVGMMWLLWQGATTDTVYSWDSLVFSNSGTSSLTAVVITEKGCTSQFSDTVTVLQSPELDLTIDNNCTGTSTEFKTNYSGSNYEHRWLIDGTSESILTTPSFVFGEQGNHIYSVTLTDLSTHCWDEAMGQFRISNLPMGVFANDLVCEGSATTLRPVLEMDSLDTVLQHTWTYHGNTIGDEAALTFIAPTAGSHLVRYSGVTQNHCVFTVIGEFITHPKPTLQAVVTPSVGVVPFAVELVATAGFEAYAWIQGSDTIGRASDITHTVTNAGVWGFSLVAIDSFGCVSVTERSVFGSLTDADLAITDIAREVVGNNTRLKISLQNVGVLSVYETRILLTAEGGSATIVHVTDTIAPSESIEVMGAEWVGAGSLWACAEIVSTNGLEHDANDQNNSLCEAFDGRNLLPLYPNPVSDQLFIRWISHRSEALTIEITSATGQAVQFVYVEVETGFNLIPLNVRNLASGLFALTIRSGDAAITAKFVKQ